MANFTRNQAETLPKSDKMPESLKKRPHKMPCIAFSEGGLIVYTCQKAATLQRNAGSARKPGNVPVHPAGVSSKENHDNMMARKSVFYATITGPQVIIFFRGSPRTKGSHPAKLFSKKVAGGFKNRGTVESGENKNRR